MKKMLILIMMCCAICVCTACKKDKADTKQNEKETVTEELTQETTAEYYGEKNENYEEYKDIISSGEESENKGYNEIIYSSGTFHFPISKDDFTAAGFQQINNYKDYIYQTSGYKFEGYFYRNSDTGGKVSTCEDDRGIYMFALSRQYLDESYYEKCTVAGVSLGMLKEDVDKILGETSNEVTLMTGKTKYYYEDTEVILELTFSKEMEVTDIVIWTKE